jgi:Arc/MetJ-type ribon-helix-helix transcriptional regulator
VPVGQPWFPLVDSRVSPITLTPRTARPSLNSEKEPPMTVELTPQQERILRDAIEQGRFRSVDEALDEALRSLSTSVDASVAERCLSRSAAAERIRELRKGNILPDGMTIRAMIDVGRE